MTPLQKLLRPLLNWLVETVFPDGAFFGACYLRNLDADTQISQKWGSVEMGCMMFIVSRLRKSGATSAAFEASDVTDNGRPVGSWKVTVEKITKEAQK